LQELSLATIIAEYNPLKLQVDRVELLAPRANISRDERGILNLNTIIKPSSKAIEPAPVEELAGPKTAEVEIGAITVSNGGIIIRDNSMNQPFTMQINDINGQLMEVASMADSGGHLTLDANLHSHAKLALAGRVNPFPAHLFTDLQLQITELEMSRLSPYSGTYIGRTFRKGKFSLKQHSRIANRQVAVDNELFWDQLTLGDSVASDKATSLPVGLAVALLKNRAGEISLDIPVSGSLDDPDFSVSDAVLQVLVNLLVKAAKGGQAMMASKIDGLVKSIFA